MNKNNSPISSQLYNQLKLVFFFFHDYLVNSCEYKIFYYKIKDINKFDSIIYHIDKLWLNLISMNQRQ